MKIVLSLGVKLKILMENTTVIIVIYLTKKLDNQIYRLENILIDYG